MFKQRRCVSCGARDWSPCPQCVSLFEPASPVAVEGARTASALVEFDGPGRDVILALKYAGARSLAPWFAGALVADLAPDIDLITWAPTTRRRRRVRGYDQAELVARALGSVAGLRSRSLLRRVDNAAAQTGRSAASRHLGPEFRLVRSVESLRIALIDDVITTGATIESAARCLLSDDAKSVDVLVLARTPTPNEMHSRASKAPL